jgi:polysaccharide biosynthesis PFTS motif protein
MKLISNWIKGRKKAKIRAYMRGFNSLVEEDRSEIVAELRNELANNPLGKKSLKSIFQTNIDSCYHQFLVYRLINPDFNKAILSAVAHPEKRVYYPLPSLWRRVLEANGFKVPLVWNILLWILFNVKWYFVGFITGLLEFCRITLNNNKNDSAVFFENLYPNTLVQSPNHETQNIVEWFSVQSEASNVCNIYHSCKIASEFSTNGKKVKFKKHGLPGLNRPYKVFEFFLWFAKKCIKTLFIQKDRLLFRQLIFQKIAQLATKEELCQMYFFHNSGHILRPLWTYDAEKKGIKIIFYFYSTNISSLKVKDKPHVQDYQWQVVSWSNYWVWNKQQSDFLNKFTLTQNNVIIKGPIPFNTSKEELNLKFDKGQKTLLIFDVQPIRTTIYASKAHSVDYHSEENCVRFLEIISDFAIKKNLTVIIKRKRENKFLSKRYFKRINRLVAENGWYDLDPQNDVFSVCNYLKPSASIAFPYTSTAVITKAYNIPTIYLDPTNKLDPSFLINNEIELLSSKEALLEWFGNI